MIKVCNKKCSAGRSRPFPPHCCRGMRPENYLVVQVEEKAQPVRRGGVSSENRHFIQLRVDQLFFSLHTNAQPHTAGKLGYVNRIMEGKNVEEAQSNKRMNVFCCYLKKS